MNDATTRISICVNSDVFVRGLRALLEEANAPNLQVEVISLVEHGGDVVFGNDILILDTELASTMLPSLSRLTKKPRIILVSEQRHASQRMADELNAACGFFPGRGPESQFKEYLRVLLGCTLHGPSEKTCKTCPLFASRRPRALPLTAREIQVFRLIGELHGISDIAEQLSVSIKTIESHCANIKHKLGLSGSREMLKAAVDWVEGR